mmetsp:Transcript_26761/g.37343  ORF Transcript_26761/g.37343 Transcript_26761/m.37343 type:complete len:283 (-) Transcript_26761:105-953(-)|eukprot:CAMPEP_0185252294 /NCGR_PEP_ID=MMETSP1359-20130426/1429_1 /TAXON_ID=552665 /ORGANISM="Bigelowiella longifila, Strain CCMP242" /LENGTH=282 /DNA_ID=CAMNT_0027834425 /DNA_START=164 /DNA_END=1012 /DNA_ORIENTATION=+
MPKNLPKRLTKVELKRLDAATVEFTRKDGTTDWDSLFKKYPFPNRNKVHLQMEGEKRRVLAVKDSDSRSSRAKRKRSLPSRLADAQAAERVLKLAKKQARFETDEVATRRSKRTRVSQSSSLDSIKNKPGNKQVSIKAILKGNAVSSAMKKQRLQAYKQIGKEQPKLSFGKTKRIMQNATSSTKLSKEAVALVSKATEMFLYFFAQEVKRVAAKKMLQSPDCERATKISEHAHFLRVALFNNYNVVSPKKEENSKPEGMHKEEDDKNDAPPTQEMVTNEADS